MKKSIRFLINSLDGGGAEKVLVELLHRLDPHRYDISLFSVTGGVHRDGIPKHVKHFQMIRVKNKKLENLLRSIIWKLPCKITAKCFLHGEYDYEIAYLEGLPTRMIAAKKTKAPKYAFVHCDISVDNIILPQYANVGACLKEYRTFNHVCFVSETSKYGFETTMGKLHNACVVHNVINFEKIKRLSQKKCASRYRTPGLKLVSVGRLTKEKNFPLLLNAVEAVEKEYPLELWILGEGDQRSTIEAMIAHKHLKNVCLLGYQENPYPFVRQAELFVCTSDFEGYSTAVSEAVCLGIPVLTTECAGMREILDDGRYGMIVGHSAEELQEKIVSFAQGDAGWNEIQNNLKNRSAENNNRSLEEFENLFV